MPTTGTGERNSIGTGLRISQLCDPVPLVVSGASPDAEVIALVNGIIETLAPNRAGSTDGLRLRRVVRLIINSVENERGIFGSSAGTVLDPRASRSYCADAELVDSPDMHSQSLRARNCAFKRHKDKRTG